ncbi:AraC family transcriptional regulator [Bacteroides cellulosilyticus]|jgi:AraC-like DNA-binding protein/acyl-CoA thioesterase FadM|uniref:AraC family transcriptional regulator n=1 Tax=Bacteroides cellulosilyticus TaxID=246787 RepID=UPI000E4CD64F|nr:AraC family transcriptional regulator [Bacteroides cellulosilyticus]RGU27887.1 AraC family transcriptional regulator [Bacteroides cellulosilyticus]
MKFSINISIFTCVLSLLLFNTPLFAQDNTYDKELERLEKKLPELSGQDKLDTLNYLVQHTAFNFPNKGRFFLKELEQEAIRQNNIRYQAFVKKKMVEIYFYQFDTDSIFQAAAIAEDFARQHQRTNDIFEVQQTVIQRYAFQGEYAKAIKAGKEMLNVAKELGDYYGMAMATAGIANNYNAMGIEEDALKHYLESINLLKKSEEEHNMLYLDLYRMVLHCYTMKMDYKNTTLYADTLQAKIEECANKKVTFDLNIYRIALESSLTAMYLDQKDNEKTYLHLTKMDSLYKRTPFPTIIYELNGLKADYYIQTGEYEKSLTYFKEAVDYLKEQEITDLQAFRHYTNYAHTLFLLKHYKKAAEIYEEASVLVKENFQQDMYAEMNQLRIMYDLDKLEMQAEKDKLQLNATHNKLIAFVITTVLLFAIILIVIYNMRRISKKNLGLVQRIREQDLLEEKLSEQREELDRLRMLHITEEPETCNETAVSQEEVLIIKLKNFLKDNPVYIDPGINRKSLAEMLGTNENYIRTAIKEQLGYTFNEYMNELRLNHTKKLLATSSDECTIEEIAIASGFNSRSTLYRKFREKYDITPDEYRKFIKRM